MFLFKIIKGFVKLTFFLLFSIIIFALIIGTIVHCSVDAELPNQNVTYMITSYNKNAEVPIGTWCQCPICEKYYYKEDVPCCSYRCEKEYHDIVKAWNSANYNKRYIENHGKKFK